MIIRSYSVVIPSHNAEETIFKAISSAQHQSLAPQEIIVVCDRNSDATTQKLSDFGYANTVVYEVDFGSSAKSRNFGASKVNTPMIAFLDADDYWEYSKIEKQLSLLSSMNESAIIATNSIYVNRHGTIVGRNIRTKNDEVANQFLKSGKGMPTLLSTWLMPVHVFRGLNGFDSTLPMSEDFDFALRAVKSGVVFKIVREPLTTYLLHSGSKTAQRKLLQNKVARVISDQSQAVGKEGHHKAFLESNSARDYIDAFVDIQIRRFLISARPNKLRRNYLRLLVAFLLNPKRIVMKFLNQQR